MQPTRMKKSRTSKSVKREILTRAVLGLLPHSKIRPLSNTQKIDLLLSSIKLRVGRKKVERIHLSHLERQAVRSLFVRDPFLFAQKAGPFIGYFARCLTAFETESIGRDVADESRRFFSFMGTRNVEIFFTNLDNSPLQGFFYGVMKERKLMSVLRTLEACNTPDYILQRIDNTVKTVYENIVELYIQRHDEKPREEDGHWWDEQY